MQLQRVLTLKQLRLISVLGQELNLSRCAERLHTTQPAVSRALAQTEFVVGHRLFERTTKRIVPTAAGLSLLQHANRVLAELDAAEQSLRGLKEGVRGELRVGVLAAFSQAVLARAVARFRELAPDVTVQIRTAVLQELYDQLTEGQIDVMLSHAELRVDLNQVQVLSIYEEHTSVAASVSHRLAGRKRLSWAELAQEAWILPSATTPLRPKLDRLLSVYRRREGAARDVEIDSPWLALQLLGQAPMLWAGAARQARLFEQEGYLRCIPAPAEFLRGPMCAFFLRDNGDRIAIRTLTECLKAAAAD